MSVCLPLFEETRWSASGDAVSLEARASAPAPARGRLLLYAATIFLSAFLLFQIQPLIGRIVLPRFGGVAAVWTTCMLFFQALLLLGYAYAHWSIQWLTPRTQRALHGVLLGAGIVATLRGLSTSAAAVSIADPTLAVLWTLATLVGLPYFILSSTGPLLQAWFAAETARVPYRLFSLSNFGSMLALLSYPLLVEPRMVLGEQTSTWAGGFVVFCALMGFVALPGWRAGTRARSAVDRGGSAPGVSDTVVWVLLAFCPSVLLLAVTHYASDAIAPIPLLWIVFLSVYLLSFILCFESDRWYRRGVFVPALFAVLALLTYGSAAGGAAFGVRVNIALSVLALFVASMACHGELARRRPDPAQLTRFYLWVSVGGVLGGVFVGLLAPHLFDDYYELGIAVVASLTAVGILSSQGARAPQLARVGAAIMAFVTVCVAGGFVYKAVITHERFVFLARNFYGKLALEDKQPQGALQRTLFHGGIIHGFQSFHVRPPQPTTYYTRGSGLGAAMAALDTARARAVGVIGLGSGTIAAYGRAGDRFRFYDINPLVVDIARRSFTYLADCRAQVDVVLGDGRLALQNEADMRFDLLVVDAFSGDSIPVHLLTREAMELYFARLARGGILAVHISNRYLDLEPVLAEHAARMGKAARVFEAEADTTNQGYATTWVLLAESADTFEHPAFRAGELPERKAGMREWADDYSSVVRLLE